MTFSAAKKKPVQGPCHQTHPLLQMHGGTVSGGNCASPPKGAFNIYVALDKGLGLPKGSQPWNGVFGVSFPIMDMNAPSDPDEFKALIDWLVLSLKNGLSAHIGCIGGHGRTGTVLAALRAREGDDDPITWVRKHYCESAVESAAQVAFLVKHFGAKETKVTKGDYLVYQGHGATKAANKNNSGTPVYGKSCAWGPELIF